MRFVLLVGLEVTLETHTYILLSVFTFKVVFDSVAGLSVKRTSGFKSPSGRNLVDVLASSVSIAKSPIMSTLTVHCSSGKMRRRRRGLATCLIC